MQASRFVDAWQLQQVTELIKTENNKQIWFGPDTIKQTQSQIPKLLNKSQK